MKIRAIVVSVLIVCGIASAIFYVHATQSADTSQTITQAIKSNDSIQLIKVLISQMKEKLEVDEDTFPSLITEVEKFTIQCTDSATRAVLHSMQAEMYNRYYQQNRWKIDQRTSLSGYVPQDIREWSANLFTQKIKEELTASLEPARLLQQTPISRFKEILETGKDSPALRPTLYDFLAFRVIQIQPSEAAYQALIRFRNNQPDKKAALLDELDYLQYKYSSLTLRDSSNPYSIALDSLLKVYGSYDFSTEIRIAQLNLMEMGTYRTTNTDSIKGLEYALCKNGISLFPNYSRIGILKNRLASLEEANLSTQTDNNVYPGKELRVKLEYTNIPQAVIRIYQSQKTALETIPYYNPADTKKATLGNLVKEFTYQLFLSNSYSQEDTTLTIPMDKPGLYECVVSVPGKNIKTNNLFSVSRLASLSRQISGGEAEVLVTDYESGKPVTDATVTYYGGKNRNLQALGTVKTDKNGLVSLPPKSNIQAYQAVSPGDTHMLMTTIYPMGTGRITDKNPVDISIFTDRGIYRPGQTIFFKGIAYVKDTDNPHVAEGKTFQVTLRDANNQEVTTKQFTTNKFGSFNGEFSIPKQTLNGTFTLSAGEARVYVRVEEYKRPTFSVELLPLKGEPAFGDLVTIEGKAQTFSGVSLQNGNVTWRIIRRPFWLRNYMNSISTEQVAEGNTALNPNGTFSLSFYPEKEATSPSLMPYQTYEVIAALTDSKGETEEARYSFNMGENSLVLFANAPEKADKDSLKIQVTAQTLNGENVSISGTYSVVKLIDTKSKEYNQEIYEVDKQVATGTFTTNEPIGQNVFSPLPSGRYRLLLQAKDNKGRLVKEQTDFILYGKHDKRPPVFSHIWLVNEKTTCFPGEEAVFTFGTSDKHTHVLYEIFDQNKCVSRKYIELNDENRTFRIPFKQEYGDGFIALFTFVKEGESYTAQVPVYRRQPDRNLSIRPETFRDHLIPGNKETWKFHILDADSVTVPTEVLASMYDASLDKILPFNWYFSPQRNINLQVPTFNQGSCFDQSNQYASGKITYLNVPEYQYDRLNWQGIMDYGYNRRATPNYMAKGMMMKSAVGKPMEESIVMDAVEETGVIAQEPTGIPPLQIRENLNETAFFYPSLLTNENGDVIFSFTTPESNTTWKLQMLANTADLKYGQLTKSVISSKPLMVLPNLPRFMRQGDEVSVSTQVINNSDKEINGRVSLELFNPETNQPEICLTKSQKPFTLSADSITMVNWTFTVPSGVDLIGCRIVAESESGSDGEQHLIPVLTNQLLMTESTPFYLMGQGEKRIQLPGSPTTKNAFRLTLELSANPVWYAVQALPVLTDPESDDILSWFASYYSNTLAAYIVQSHPRLQNVIKQWTAQGGDASSLLSNLEKNQELKNILLQETPWVLAAQNETEQKQRLALLFDLNRASGQREAALQQLLQQQNEDGGWSWFKGFTGSRSITLSILKGMSQLTQLGAIEYGQQEKEMQIKALNYLDKGILSDYNLLKKNTKQIQAVQPSAEQIEYLYVRSSYRDIPEWGDAREAIRFYSAQTEKFWEKQSLIGKGEIALLMHRNGKKEVANTILAWLKKTATTSEDKGMYWANNRRGTDYFTSPIDAHCLLMSVFKELAPTNTDTDGLKQWLLNQKRMQQWESVPATVNAIYAILLTGSNWLNENNACTVQWGGKTFSTTTGESAIGYIKEIIPQKEITSQMNSLTVRKEGNAPAWGAVYRQYFESIDKIQKQSGVLNVEKKLFIETNSGSGLQLVPVTPQRALRVGDKVVVRLTVRTDREMDYVFLKDLRAGCFEPANQLSGSEYREGIWYYRSPQDVSENFFFNRLPQGTYVLEYAVYVSRSGEYAGGISTIQCMYAPEFVSHTAGEKMIVHE